ncbi:hypothetical protein D3C80_2213860 [compost metagenome]
MQIGRHEASRVSAIERPAAKLEGANLLACHQRNHGVCQLDLAACAGFLAFKDVEDLGLQDVAS